MQFDLLRAFPYPVLRPGVDDYLDRAIQVNVGFKESEDGLHLTADIEFALSVSEIGQLVEEGKAEYVVVFACRDTYFRRACGGNKATFSDTFPTGSLRGQVLIYPYIVAVQEIKGFKCKWINPEFGKGPFQFGNGAALALDAPQAVFIDRESFKPLSSCFTLVKGDHVPAHEWQLATERDKVQIIVSPALKERIDAARNSKEKRAILMNSIYFGAVMQCLSDLKSAEDLEQWRWQRIFVQRMSDSGVDLQKHGESWIAQQLLRHPLSTIDQYFLGG